ncbi:MAG: TetR/AcrR family transcriptional regulator [Cyanobacteria bacterium P01_H01_bin.162]
MPKIVDHDRYRQELLSQCLTLFAERGFGAVTMREIAASLGVSTGTLYHYFPNKERIFVQLVETYCEKDVAEFFAQAPLSESLENKLRRITTFFLQRYSTYQRQFLIWIDFYQHSQRSQGSDWTVLQQSWQRTQSQLVDYLQIAPEQVDSLLIFLDGLLLQCLYGRVEVDITQQLEVFMQVLEQACRSD